MNCRFCSASNISSSVRCERCGRRHWAVEASASTLGSGRYPTPILTAAAPDLFMGQAIGQAWGPVAVAEERQESVRPRPVYQRSLFESQVVQLPVYPVDARARRSPRASGPRRRPVPQGQQAFDFDAAAACYETPQARVIEAEFTPEPVMARHGSIYCDAPVAHPSLRLTAAALDGSMILIGLGLFLCTYVLCGGKVALTLPAGALFAGVGVVLWFFYTALFGICNADTPGMVWTNLRLVNFEGFAPDREQRVYRMFGGVLGFLSAGLGLVWSLVDEEHLTWHDHISKTFPSPVQA